jgi:hypothetical protein
MPLAPETRLWLLTSPFVASALDVALTLMGQPSPYWQGDYSSALESNPLAWLFLWAGPEVFAAGILAYWLLFVAVVLKAQKPFVMLASFAATLGHSIGAATWLWRFGIVGVLLSFVVFVAMERLLSVGWRMANAAGAKESPIARFAKSAKT